MKVFILAILITTFIFSKEQIFFLPQDSNKAISIVQKLIHNSKKSIDIAMYNFTYKKFAKLLTKSAKKGVKVTLILDKNKSKKEKDSQYNYLKKNSVNIVLLKNKLHIKMAIFDNKIVLFGSANWKKKSFNGDYEIIYLTNKKTIVNKLNNVFNKLLLEKR